MKNIIRNKIIYPIKLLITILKMRQRRKKMAGNNTTNNTNNEQFILRNGGTIVNNMNDMVIGMDLLAGNYTFVNPSCYKMFGYTQEEYLAMPIKDTMLPSSYKSVQTAIEREFARYFRGEVACPEATLQMQQYCKDGTIKWVEASATTIINEKKELVEIVAITRDIDEKKKIELQNLEQKEELIRVNDTKNVFFSIISHDLRNQVTALVNITSVLSSFFQNQAYADATKYIGMLSDSVSHLLNLFENLLLWSRSIMNGIEMNLSENNIDTIAEELISEFKTQGNQKQIYFLYRNSASANIALCDFFMVNTVLRNLLSNAMKFSNNFGKIRVLVNDYSHGLLSAHLPFASALNEESSVRNGTERNGTERNGTERNGGKYIVVSVKDEGVGMSAEKLEQLFKLNTQVSTLGTANEKGSGIGLILCKEFINKHKCNIWVESEPGKGSTFSFTLPRGR